MRWSLGAILNTVRAALTDANFHTEGEAVGAWVSPTRVTPAQEALGQKVSATCQWSGSAIAAVGVAALTDANHHLEAAKLAKLFDL
jgi:hypothetical protein